MTVVGSNWSLEVDLQVVTYVSVSFLALLIYDWIICLDREVHRIWWSKWSLVKVLYLYARYSPFLSMIISVEERISSICNLWTFTTIYAGFGIGVADLILMLRTYSLYNKSRRVLAIFGLTWLTIAAVCTWAITRFTNTFAVDQSASSCFLSKESGVVFICYISLLASETVVTLLTVWKTFNSYRKSGFQLGQVMSMVYCEGLFFYFLIIPFTIANVAVLFAAPSGLYALLDTPLTVMHSVLCCRLVLHVREVSDYNTDLKDEEDLLPAFVVTVIEPYMSSEVPRYYV